MTDPTLGTLLKCGVVISSHNFFGIKNPRVRWDWYFAAFHYSWHQEMFDVAQLAVKIAGWKAEHGVGKNRRQLEWLKKILINSYVPLHSCERICL